MAKPSSNKNRRQKKRTTTRYRKYSNETLAAAVQWVRENKKSLRLAAKKFSVPKSTIEDKLKNLHPRTVGQPTVLSISEEKRLVSGILKAAEWGFPYTKNDIRDAVKCYLDRTRKGITTRFPNNYPGRNWVKGFLRRHRDDLTIRLTQNVKRSRAEVGPETIQKFFNNLQPLLEDVPPSNIINYDETNLSDDPGRQKVVVRRKTKRVDRILDSSKSSTSVMIAGAADGTLWPPYVVFKAEQMWESWTQNGPRGARYNRSKSGWFDMRIFEDWFEKLALPRLKKLQGIKILIGDNVGSHLSLTVIELCVNYQIHFVLLPPNSTHLLQPLDVAFFKGFKSSWRNVLLEWKKKNRGSLPKEYFPSLLKACLEKTNISRSEKSTSLISGFKASGICPFSPKECLKKIPSIQEKLDMEEASAWLEVFEKKLQEERFASKPQRRTRKKINVEPGCSVSAPDESESDENNSDTEFDQNDCNLDDNHTESDENHPKSDEINSESDENNSESDENSTSDENYSESDENRSESDENEFNPNKSEDHEDQVFSESHLDLESTDEYEVEVETLECYEDELYPSSDANNNEDTISNMNTSFQKGDFVKVQYFVLEKQKSVEKFYIGEVSCVFENTCTLEIRFLKQYLQAKNTFVFPTTKEITDLVNIKDTEIVTFDRVMEKLPFPTIKRGKHIFQKYLI